MIKPKIRVLQIHVVEHCNFKCPKCSHSSNIAKESFNDANYFLDALKKLHEYGDIEALHLMGGEPFLHPNFDKFIEIIKKNPFKVPITICSNGFWLKNWRNYINILKNVQCTVITLYPQINMSKEEINFFVKEIEKENISLNVSVMGRWLDLNFIDEAIKRTYCKFCPQLMKDYKLAKCQVIGYYDKNKTSKTFEKERFKGIYNIIGGNKESLEIWNNNLPYCCDYCLFKREIEMPNG